MGLGALFAHFAAHGYHGYAMNLTGSHGAKPVTDLGRISFYDHLADIRAVAQQLGRSIVVGHSVGGLLTQKLAETTALAACVLISLSLPISDADCDTLVNAVEGFIEQRADLLEASRVTN